MTSIEEPMITVRHLLAGDLDDADRVMRVAFGSFLGMPDPTSFMGDADYVRTRWAADPDAAFAAEVQGRLVGTNFATRWGSVGFFGPLTVAPDMWNRGVAQHLLDRTMASFDDWGVRHRGLFTFSHSPRHLALYQRYGFLPRFLTSVMVKSVEPKISAGPRTFSAASDPVAEISACADLTGAIYPGLDLEREILATHTQLLGDTLLIDEGADLAGLAVCHVGAGSEAGSGTCFVKFGAVRPGEAAPVRFARLLAACEGFAAERGATLITAGVSTARRGAYQAMVDLGYRAQMIGVTMHLPDDAAYHHPGAWVLDDWR